MTTGEVVRGPGPCNNHPHRRRRRARRSFRRRRRPPPARARADPFRRGPTAFGALVAAGLLDELFLTTSPLLAGRSGRSPRPALVERAEFLPATTVEAKLLTLRRAGSHLFARYQLPNGQALGDGQLQEM